MPSQRYVVDSAAPISIYPAGLQKTVTVLNVGSAVAYVSDTASDMVGYPLPAGGAVQWNAHTPLYARVDDGGDPTYVVVNDTAGVLPFANVGVSGGVQTSGLIPLAVMETGTFGVPGGSGRLSTLGYASLTIVASGLTATSARELRGVVYWYDALSGGNLIGRDGFVASVSTVAELLTSATVRVRGPYCRVQLEIPNVDVTDWNVTVYGQAGPTPEAFVTDGDGNYRPSWRHVTAQFTIPASSSQLWYPGSIAGPAVVSIRLSQAATAGAFVALLSTVFDGAAYQYVYRHHEHASWPASHYINVHLAYPFEPVIWTLANETGSPLQVTIGVVYEGNV